MIKEKCKGLQWRRLQRYAAKVMDFTNSVNLEPEMLKEVNAKYGSDKNKDIDLDTFEQLYTDFNPYSGVIKWKEEDADRFDKLMRRYYKYRAKYERRHNR
ncbi:hypothetical protein LJC34_02515 [Oscillospiraceae bacterium OttesenSCG-928-G22]|nr:hypothetical protein [Oscillospiraceae bacterium OttesenSCG-928-G22]